MESLDLSVAQRRLYEATLLGTYELRIRVRLQTLSGDDLSDISARLLDGQVNIDTTAETTRQSTVLLNDPSTALNLDSDSPGDGALYVDRMLRVDYCVWVSTLSRWVNVPIFTGPITSMRRSGAQLEVTALGKEYLAKGQAWHPLMLHKGHDKVDAIRTILRERAGETRFAFPNLAARLPQNFALGRMSQPWVAAQTIARSMGRQLYYDGAGVCRLRSVPHTCCYTFRDGNGALLSDPEVVFNIDDVRNAVWVKGGKPKGSKTAVTSTAVAPASHALSPWRLGRNSTPRFLVEEVDNDHVRTKVAANQLAHTTLNARLLEGVDVSFDSLPIPHLEPLDVVRVATDLTSVAFILRQASIPLLHDGTMSVGTTKRVTIRRQAVR